MHPPERLALVFGGACPSCAAAWDVRPAYVGDRQRGWEHLAHRCHECGLGFSNNSDPARRVPIWRSPRDAVPTEVREGLDDVLGRALNLKNRDGKRVAFCSENSEDAATWAVFAGLDREHLLDRVAAVVDPVSPRSVRRVLLPWSADHCLAGLDGRR